MQSLFSQKGQDQHHRIKHNSLHMIPLNEINEGLSVIQIRLDQFEGYKDFQSLLDLEIRIRMVTLYYLSHIHNFSHLFSPLLKICCGRIGLYLDTNKNSIHSNSNRQVISLS